MTIIKNNYYDSEWNGMETTEAFEKANQQEKKLMEYLKEKCGFEDFMQTAKLIRTDWKKRAIPDITGFRKGQRYLLDLKRKNRLLHKPQTGFDEKLKNDYIYCSKQTDSKCLVVFKDNPKELERAAKKLGKDCYSKFIEPDGTGAYYGGFLNSLIKKIDPNNRYFYTRCPRTKNKILLFPLSILKRIDNLFDERQTQLNFGVIK